MFSARMRRIIAVVALITVGSSGVSVVAQSEVDAARGKIMQLLLRIVSQVPDEILLQRGIGSGDIDRAKTCSVEALMADIPDEAVIKIVEMLGRSPVPRDQLIEHWLFPDLSKNIERREQINSQVARICPEFQEQLKEY